jgi:hypothetical protein
VTGSSPPSALSAVQRAALDRAQVDGVEATQYLQLVGALETAREAAGTVDASGTPLPGLACLVSLAAVYTQHTDAPTSGTPPSPPEPPAFDDAAVSDDLRVDGAVVAHRRFDVSVGRAAAMAAIPTVELEARLASEPDS